MRAAVTRGPGKEGGIITSGMISEDLAVKLLQTGPVYTQIAIKTEKALSKLQFLSSSVISREEVAEYRKTVREEEKEFQAQFMEKARELAVN